MVHPHGGLLVAGGLPTVYIVSASAAVLQYGTQVGGVCDEPHINRISFTLAGNCGGGGAITIKIWSPTYGEEAGPACSIGANTHDSFNPESEETEAGSGTSVTYWVRVYEDGILISQKQCNAITWTELGDCVGA